MEILSLLSSLVSLVSDFVLEFKRERILKKEKTRELAEGILPDLRLLCKEMQGYVYLNKLETAEKDNKKYNNITELLNKIRDRYERYSIYLTKDLSFSIDIILLGIEKYCNRFTFLKGITQKDSTGHIPFHLQADVNEKRKIVSVIQKQLPKRIEAVKQQFSRSI
ncbi:MAG: hypothetical protein ACLTNA_21900 [Bacteroides thetaiotaomicron]